MSIETYREQSKKLLTASPSLKELQDRVVLIKYGGAAMEDSELRLKTAVDIALLREFDIHPIVVHGGGKEISRWMERLGIEARFVEGLRYTDSSGIEITEMILSGKINSELVSLLTRSGAPAIGLSGKDAGLFVSKIIKSQKGEDLGFVGEILSVNTNLLRTLIDNKLTPVISCIGPDENGQTLNHNADHVAAKLASALEVSDLVFLSDVDGVLLEGKLLSDLSSAKSEQMIQTGAISGGMIPKARAAMSAVDSGVRNAVLVNGARERSVIAALTSQAGTRFTK